MKGRGGAAIGIVLLVVVVVAILALSRPPAPPFDADSSAPNGYKAVRLLLEDAGVQVRERSAENLFGDGGDDGGGVGDEIDAAAGHAVVVPVWSYLSDSQREQLEDLAADGALVVRSDMDGLFEIDDQALTRDPAVEVRRGFCDIAELEDLRAIDDIGYGVIDAEEGDERCFGDATAASVTRRGDGAGAVVELSTPYLWANARLQPNKEEGGRALDNGPLAVALLSGSGTVTFLEAEPTPGFTPEGEADPLELLPLGVKLGLAQAVGAFCIYAWWRGRRLGRPVRERLPVEVAGSELTEAVGGLLRRNGSARHSAEVVRRDTCRLLATRLGVPPEAGVDRLVTLVAARSGRAPEEVHDVLVGRAIDSSESLVRLLRDLDSLRTEVLHGQPV